MVRGMTTTNTSASGDWKSALGALESAMRRISATSNGRTESPPLTRLNRGSIGPREDVPDELLFAIGGCLSVIAAAGFGVPRDELAFWLERTCDTLQDAGYRARALRTGGSAVAEDIFTMGVAACHASRAFPASPGPEITPPFEDDDPHVVHAAAEAIGREMVHLAGVARDMARVDPSYVDLANTLTATECAAYVADLNASPSPARQDFVRHARRFLRKIGSTRMADPDHVQVANDVFREVLVRLDPSDELVGLHYGINRPTDLFWAASRMRRLRSSLSDSEFSQEIAREILFETQFEDLLPRPLDYTRDRIEQVVQRFLDDSWPATGEPPGGWPLPYAKAIAVVDALWREFKLGERPLQSALRTNKLWGVRI